MLLLQIVETRKKCRMVMEEAMVLADNADAIEDATERMAPMRIVETRANEAYTLASSAQTLRKLYRNGCLHQGAESCLHSLRPEERMLHADILAGLGDPDAEVRREAVWFLGLSSLPSEARERYAPTIAAKLEDADAEVRREAVQFLRSLPSRGVAVESSLVSEPMDTTTNDVPQVSVLRALSI